MANGHSPEDISAPYLELLRSLYSEEYPFAQLTDSSDLVARFSGPAVDVRDPTVSVVISVFSDIREQIRAIAKSVVGLATDRQVRWPAHLDPHLSGITHGSLIVGVSVAPPPLEDQRAQLELAGVSDQVFESIRVAVRSLSAVAHHISDVAVMPSLRDAIPDPAVRDTVLVAAKRLAPTGRRGITAVTFFSSGQQVEAPAPLTSRSRLAIAAELHAPVHLHSQGSFEGVLREVDLDAKRFEIRGVADVGSLRCAYGDRHESEVRRALDVRVRVGGTFETLPNGRPRLVAVESLEVTAAEADRLVNEGPKYVAPMFDTPQTITVVPREVIEQQNLLNLRDVLQTLPGITFGAGEGGGGYGDSINLRGFSASNDQDSWHRWSGLATCPARVNEGILRQHHLSGRKVATKQRFSVQAAWGCPAVPHG